MYKQKSVIQFPSWKKRDLAAWRFSTEFSQRPVAFKRLLKIQVIIIATDISLVSLFPGKLLFAIYSCLQSRKWNYEKQRYILAK